MNSYLGSVWILFITENWIYCSKIIFKCVNSVVGISFKEKFAEICTCGSREQCMGSTEKTQMHIFFSFLLQSKPSLRGFFFLVCLYGFKLHLVLTLNNVTPLNNLLLNSYFENLTTELHGLGLSYTWCNSKQCYTTQ